MIRSTTRRRRGAILPLVTLSLIALFAMVALAIDLGMIALARNQCQNAADASALAGTRQLNGDTTVSANLNNYSAVDPAVKNQVAANKVLGTQLTAGNVTYSIGYYAYDATAQRFQPIFSGSKPAAENWSAVQTNITANNSTFFARVFNMNAFTATATATAVHRPRDIAIVLDFSGSMRYSCQTAYPSSGDYSGSLNPDPVFPKFGHWSAMSSVMQRTSNYIDGGGETHAPNNLTTDTDNGPAIIKDFLYRDGSGSLQNAFHRVTSPYSATTWACPAPDDWDTQGSGTATYLGDKWPGVSKNVANGYARTVQHYLFGTTSSSTYTSNTHTKSTTPGGGTGPFDPANPDTPTANEGYGPNFTGYSMGPGYYGKTFYIWPPDPRWQTSSTSDVRLRADWRKRFFYNGGSSTPLGGSSAGADNRVDNTRLFDTSGYWQQAGSTTYAINYDAILAWIKSGPQVLPPNLRAGRVLYYSAIPDTIPSSGGTLDQMFWRDYINHVVGAGSQNTRQQTLYGEQTSAWGTMKITAKSSLATDASTRPFMHYNDNPVRPRLHMWFGPLTMLAFIADTNATNYNRNWMPGTCHESQCWQLKAGIQSALEDIQKNHPNDWCSMLFFSGIQEYTTPRVENSRDYATMKNVLFFPFSLRNSLGDTNAEVRPYNDTLGDISKGEIPNAVSNTSPECGFKMAYNQFSTASTFKGRRGAAKMVIFETDGVPNTQTTSSFVNGGAHKSYYTSLTVGSNVGNNNSTVVTNALATVTQICADETASPPGYSTAKAPARVHAIGFGDLFESGSTAETQSRAFLLNVQKNGNTSSSGDSAIESYKIIIGDYNTRIGNLKTAMERIMQSGIQVTLIR